MHRFTIVATALAALSTMAAPVLAQPHGRAQADTGSADEVVDDDGPEAKNVAKFRLDDIIEVAVRLSPDIARARTQRTIGQDAAEAAGRDQAWVLSASINGTANSVGSDGADFAPLQEIGDKKVEVQLEMGRKLPSGGSIDFSVGGSHDERELNVPQDLISQATAMGGGNCNTATPDIFCTNQAIIKASISQPIGRGVGSDVALSGQRKADLAAVDATIKAQQVAEQMVQDIVVAYWDLAYSAYEVDVRAASLQAAKDQESVVRQELRASNGTVTQVDSVLVEESLRDEALLEAKLAFEQKSLDFRRKVGLEIGRRDIVVRPADPLEIDDADWNIEDILAKSHKFNRSVASLVVERKSADVDVAVAHDATKPKFDLSLSIAGTGTGNTASEAFGAASPGNTSGFGYQVTGGISMSFEVSGAARAGERAAQSKAHLLDIERIDAERQNDAQIVSQVKVLVSGKTRIALSDKAIRFANESVKTARQNFLGGKGTNLEVMRAQSQVLDAELKRGKAVADYRSAVVKLQFLSGTLLEAYRIHVRAPSEGGSGDLTHTPSSAKSSQRDRADRSDRRTARAGDED